jgi:chemotaxis signal transduction protein
MLTTLTAPSPLSSSEVSQDAVRMITFTIADHLLALPMNAIVKVVGCPPKIAKSGSSIELFHFGNYSITVLNLNYHFACPATPGDKFLVVTKQKHQELYALLVDTPPDLVDFPGSTIRQLPESYRHGHALSIASCVVVLPQAEGVASIFVIDMEKASQVCSSQSQTD